MSQPAQNGGILPETALFDQQGRLYVGGCSVPALAERFGTPLYLYDAATLDAAVAAYRSVLAAHYQAEAGVAYAAKAWLCLATARWAAQRGIGLDVVSGGELEIALRAGFPAGRIHFHGNNKTLGELEQALDARVGRVVIDHPDELLALDALARARGRQQAIWLRINPNLAADTHRHIHTGHATSKFGLSLADGTAEAVARQALSLPGVDLVGLHCHLGSQLRDPKPIGAAVERLLALAADLRTMCGWQPAELSPGGGWAVPYTPGEADAIPPLGTYVSAVAQALIAGCRTHGLSLPALVLEPGRSLVARAGVAVYAVGAIKPAGPVTYAFVDGGLADNPRPALYGARYTALLANRSGGPERQAVHVAGPYCESGDVLIRDLALPPLRTGDLLAVPVSGAYQLSMSSNYNAARRPAVVWAEGGEARLVQRRETTDDLLLRDV